MITSSNNELDSNRASLTISLLLVFLLALHVNQNQHQIVESILVLFIVDSTLISSIVVSTTTKSFVNQLTNQRSIQRVFFLTIRSISRHYRSFTLSTHFRQLFFRYLDNIFAISICFCTCQYDNEI